jgi:hypothetical protein
MHTKLVVLGRDNRLPIDIIFPLPDKNNDIKCSSEFVLWMEDKIKKNFQFARSELNSAFERQKNFYDRTGKQRTLEAGDNDLRFYPPLLRNKLQHHRLGPFKVIKRINDVLYEIETGNRKLPKVAHIDHLKLVEHVDDMKIMNVLEDENLDNNEPRVQRIRNDTKYNLRTDITKPTRFPDE